MINPWRMRARDTIVGLCVCLHYVCFNMAFIVYLCVIAERLSTRHLIREYRLEIRCLYVSHALECVANTAVFRLVVQLNNYAHVHCLYLKK